MEGGGEWARRVTRRGQWIKEYRGEVLQMKGLRKT